MLGVLISHLERTTLLEAELRLMGQRHAGYGVQPRHYEVVGAALMDMLAETLRADFTPDVRAAWTVLYDAVAEAMLTGAAAAPAMAMTTGVPAL